jgi:hypothetical protein
MPLHILFLCARRLLAQRLQPAFSLFCHVINEARSSRINTCASLSNEVP